MQNTAHNLKSEAFELVAVDCSHKARTYKTVKAYLVDVSCNHKARNYATVKACNHKTAKATAKATACNLKADAFHSVAAVATIVENTSATKDRSCQTSNTEAF